MRDVTVVVLGKYKDVFQGFLESAEQHIAAYPKIFVRDGHDIPVPNLPSWTTVQGPEKFSMAGNANLGWRSANPQHDLLYASDDVRFEACFNLELLRQAAYSSEKLGIVSPHIIGAACNKLQVDKQLVNFATTDRALAFICVYIKRDLIDKIGMLDEEFNEYGYDDVDYCRRAQQAGFELGVTPFVKVIHWGEAHATFSRNPKETWTLEKNREYYKKKWGES